VELVEVVMDVRRIGCVCPDSDVVDVIDCQVVVWTVNDAEDELA
jgi:hypothetical protein